MKRQNLSYTLTFLLMVGAIASATAQNSEKGFYGRPTNWRPYDQRGINYFETPKGVDTIPFEGVRVSLGAGFTQQFQNLTASNTAANNQTTNKLYPLAPGFMTAQANLFLDVQLADGIRLNVTSYLSGRRHNEEWVKGGYIQFDKLPLKGQFFSELMKYATIKVGHMEVNYGDDHYRRPDGGQTIYTPFMEGNIMDAFTTEIGGEVYLQKNGLIGMLGLTSGMIKGNIDSVLKSTVADGSDKRSPSIYGKIGFDKHLTENVRLRITGSWYYNGNSNGSGLTLYNGDRTGSNYQNVVEKWKDATGAVQATTAIPVSGRLNPGFSKKVSAKVLNGFLKAGGLEIYGTYELAKGKSKSETADRKATQFAGDVVYRFGANENLFIGGRYNTVRARLSGFTSDITINRVAGAAGWFLTKNVLLKGEIVNQQFNDFPTTDYRNGAKFSGYVVEAVVGF